MEPWLYFLIIGGLFFLMMRSGCGAHVMGHHHRDHDERMPGPYGNVPIAAPAQARDPVCGMTIDTATAKTSLYRGGIRYFCSADCRGKFEASPDTYESRPQPVEQHHG